MGTTNAARDMDLMHQVLGDKKLYYFGISYGTELGGVYAHLYPKNVGRAVFDAVVDPTDTSEQSALGQAKGFQLALTNWAKNCVARGDQCLVPGSTPQEIQDWIIALLKRLDQHPIPGSGDRKLTQTEATNGIAQTLYSTEYWELLEQGLDEADGGNGTLLLALSDALNGRSENGDYSNIQAANAAINCVDYKDRYTVEQTRAKLPQFREVSPVFGDTMGWGLMGCSQWPVPGTWRTPNVSAPGSAPILLVGNTGDPAHSVRGYEGDGGRARQGRRHRDHVQGRGPRRLQQRQQVCAEGRERLPPGRQGSRRRNGVSVGPRRMPKNLRSRGHP